MESYEELYQRKRDVYQFSDQQVCAESGVSAATLSRHRHGTHNMERGTLHKLLEAIDSLHEKRKVAEKARDLAIKAGWGK